MWRLVLWNKDSRSGRRDNLPLVVLLQRASPDPCMFLSLCYTATMSNVKPQCNCRYLTVQRNRDQSRELFIMSLLFILFLSTTHDLMTVAYFHFTNPQGLQGYPPPHTHTHMHSRACTKTPTYLYMAILVYNLLDSRWQRPMSSRQKLRLAPVSTVHHPSNSIFFSWL